MKRDVTIDFAKGIAICFMVLAHSYTNYSNSCGITTLINSFHMLFFFICSGMLSKMTFTKNGQLSFDVKKKLKSLILPYCIWGGYMKYF